MAPGPTAPPRRATGKDRLVAHGDRTMGMKKTLVYHAPVLSITDSHLSSGSPYRPKMVVRAYIFSFFNENLKPGPTFERNFGLFKPDGSIAYDIGFTGLTSSGTSSFLSFKVKNGGAKGTRPEVFTQKEALGVPPSSTQYQHSILSSERETPETPTRRSSSGRRLLQADRRKLLLVYPLLFCPRVMEVFGASLRGTMIREWKCSHEVKESLGCGWRGWKDCMRFGGCSGRGGDVEDNKKKLVR
ncbi:hypothetical protein VIGAN_09070400 [Vigna angularis var. angularis]|uniref:glucan endo-1,3-beta-D-glucosidase n=1 Tax=Vigna angularis var. angularis TaxID=157739 RepID=A0A0S3SWL9_PHAAN|nr:hypothetical protein VIGAN_09070400 [Vigna angularis var. angularis]